MPPINDLLQLINAGGTVALLILVVYGFLTERIVPRGRLEDQRAQTREAMDLARAANAAISRLSDAVEARNQLEAERLRLEAMKQ